MKKTKLIFSLFFFSVIIFASCKNEDETTIKSIKIDLSKLTLKVGERKRLQATVEPENAIYKTLVWSSSNEKVATIDKQTGEVYALKAGTATIVAMTIEGLKSEACYITVIEPDVYIVGRVYEKNSTAGFVTLWKNGVSQRLGEAHYGSDYFSVFVTDNNDVYVAATTPDGPYEVATIWKNGVEQKLCNIWVNNQSQARSVCVAGENVYVVGIVQGRGAIWINGEVKILDRRIYPTEVKFVVCKTHIEVAQAITDMVTQSAGPYTAAGMGMALAAKECESLGKEEYDIDPRRTAGLLDIFSSAFQGIIPYGGQLLVAAGIAGISPVAIVPHATYSFLMIIFGVLAIITGRPKFKSDLQETK